MADTAAVLKRNLRKRLREIFSSKKASNYHLRHSVRKTEF
ncbi:hypothetical protein LEP1GSC061_2865 [Leptospira wolffii serovar Khorat str. Khorat-H2]|nr:hypothetical protein LEP1GSC061_2865 [Leptospira wolffii serovar Khorat str. Khorat-H2]